ncbi:class II aldolase/adducin family protein [Streptomyces sp. NPDC002187]|uniref:class II aldolase/adducin family protein n=1 Tax=Streptomyces sp. NPDC002187 TaxID=3364637 RepID=UPI0036956314
MHSGDLATSADLVSAVRLLRSERLLDWTGGALSARGKDAMLISRGGAARKFWLLDDNDIMSWPYSGVPHESAPRPPLGVAVHQCVYRHFPWCTAVVHSHAGDCFLTSCLSTGLKASPPTETLGEIPNLGDSKGGSGGAGTSGGLSIIRRAERERDVLLPQIVELAEQRGGEMAEHGLAFLDHGHGIYVLGRSLSEALTDLAKAEAGCRLWTLRSAQRTQF